MGRKTGSRNVGFFFRKGRGWVMAADNGRMVQLRDASGEPLRSKSTPITEVKAACQRERDRIIAPSDERVNASDVSVEDVCTAYLDKAKESRGENKTFTGRRRSLYDFCTGFPPRFINSVKPPQASDRIHKGYGQEMASITGLDVDRWLAAHKTWGKGKRFHIQAVKRAFNYAVESGLLKLPASPLRGYRLPQGSGRITYLTPEQEAALCRHTNAAMATAIKVLIRTGARPGCEFAALTAKHIKDHGQRMEWTFQPEESKTGLQTGKPRVIRITDPAIIKLVRKQMDAYPRGPIFRSENGGAWTVKNMSTSFRRAEDRARKRGIEFDDDNCLYACRHTYAKRTLQGFWTGKQTNIETLARLMGNSPQICAAHYLQWSESYNEPLWESA